MRTLVSQLERLTSAMDEIDRAATTLLPPSEPGTGPSDAELLQTIPGIGPQTAATLIGELGTLTRFTGARALVAYVGFYPVINQSGDRAATPRLSRVGSRIARHSLYLAAVNAVRRSAEWRTIYLRKKAQGKTAKQALVVVAVKLLHAVYAMLKHTLQLVQIERLVQVAERAQGQRVRLLAGIPVSTHHEDRRAHAVVENVLQHVETLPPEHGVAYSRHDHVQKNQVEALTLQDAQRFSDSLRRRDLVRVFVPVGGDELAQHAEHVRLVIDDQDSLRRQRHPTKVIQGRRGAKKLCVEARV